MYGLSETREELIQIVKSLPDDVLHRKVDSDSWSIMEILEHLNVTESYMTEKIIEILQNVQENQPVRVKPMDSVLDRSKKYKAPEFLEPNNISTNIEEILEKLNKSRQNLFEIITKNKHKDFSLISAKHIAFGTISVEQWIKFIALHEKRHIHQIIEIIDQV